MMLHNVAEQRKLAESEVLKESLHAAELTTSKEEQVMDGARQLLTVLHQVFRAIPEEGSNCQAFLRELLGRFQRYSNLGAVNREGYGESCINPVGLR